LISTKRNNQNGRVKTFWSVLKSSLVITKSALDLLIFTSLALSRQSRLTHLKQSGPGGTGKETIVSPIHTIQNGHQNFFSAPNQPKDGKHHMRTTTRESLT
jgi:hypothetical protein